MACSAKMNFHKTLSFWKIKIIFSQQKSWQIFFSFVAFLDFNFLKFFEPPLWNIQICENSKITFVISTLFIVTDVIKWNAY